jgi:hypothetical protein
MKVSVEITNSSYIVFADFYCGESEEILLVDEVESVLGCDVEEARLKLGSMDQQQLLKLFERLRKLTEEARC